jgi:hypothetical protein
MKNEAVSQQIQELEQLRRQTRRFTRVATLALVAIVVAGAALIIDGAYGLAQPGPKQDEFVKHLGTQLNQQVLPAVQKAAEPALKRLRPDVETELKRLDARAPQLAEAALKELEKLGTNLPVRAEAVLDRSIGKTLHAREARLRQMYPGLYDARIATLLENLEAETRDQVAATGEKIFNPHLNSIQHILASLEKIQQTEPLDPQAEINLWQVAFLFVDVFTQENADLAAVKSIRTAKN